MIDAEVLVLHGSPGSGKTTLAHALFDRLSAADAPVAVLDRDEFAIVHPGRGDAFSVDNLAAVWPNYTAVPRLHAIVPTVVVDSQDHGRLRYALPCAKFMICELTAARATLERRVVEREPDEHWGQVLLRWVEVYHRRGEDQRFGDFTVRTDENTVEVATTAILRAMRWPAGPPP